MDKTKTQKEPKRQKNKNKKNQPTNKKYKYTQRVKELNSWLDRTKVELKISSSCKGRIN